MPDLDLQALPAELQAALERVWPCCPEAHKRALLAPPALGAAPLWPTQLWPWQPARRWWRPFAARNERQGWEHFFGQHVGDARGARHDGLPTYPQRLFDPEQPFFETPWTNSRVLLRSPVPDVFSDADFWFMTQQLSGGDSYWAGVDAENWARGMRADRALHGARRDRWLADALWRQHMSSVGDYT